MTSNQSKKVFIVAVLLLLCAIAGSVYLVYVASNINAVGCVAGESCDQVLTSRWSQWFGVSVAVLGGLSYTGLLACLIVNRRKSSAICSLVQVALCLGILLAVAWFVILQQFAIGAYCYRCCIVHGLAAVAAILSFLLVGKGASGKIWKGGLAVGWIFFICFAAGQVLQKVKTPNLSHEVSVVALSNDGNRIHFHGGEKSFVLADMPVLVQGKTEKCAFLVTDYTCVHCLEYLHQLLVNEETVSATGSLYLIPAYNDASARDMQRVMLTVARLDMDVYRELIVALLENEIAMDSRQLKRLANNKLSGRYSYYEFQFLKWSEDMLLLGESVVEGNEITLNAVAMPQLIAGDTVIEGKVEMDELTNLLSDVEYAAYVPENSQDLKRGEGKKSDVVVIQGINTKGKRVFKNDTDEGWVLLKNTRDSEVTLESIRVTCSCIEVDKSLFPLTLRAGEKYKLPYKFHTKKFLGRVTHKMIMTQEGEERLSLIVPITVNVWLPFRAAPYSVNLGSVAEGEQSKQRVSQLMVMEKGEVFLELLNQKELREKGLNVELRTLIDGRHYELIAQMKEMGSEAIETHALLKTSHPDAPEVKLPLKVSLKQNESTNE